MNEEKILDSDFIFGLKERLYNSITWWESNRLIYNCIVIFCEVIMMGLLWEGTKRFGVGSSIFWSVLYTLAANVFYSMGWGTEILVEYYFKESQWIEKYRKGLFLLGIIFSILLTLFLYFRSLFP